MEKALIQQARQTNLASYLLSVGVPLVRNGDRYRHAEHNSLTFTENAYCWNSRQETGNAVDYLMRHMGVDFISAVLELTSHERTDEQLPNTNQSFNFANLALNSKVSRATAYLNKTRHVSNNVINHLIKNKLLFQQKQTNNAVFAMYDENNEIVGAELQGTLSHKRFKGVAKDSKYGYGFNVRFSGDGTFDYALFFESAVDLISFVDYKLHNERKSLDRCILVSMAGLKANILSHTLKVYQGNIKAVLCVDNDEAGQVFRNKAESEKIPFIVCAPDEPCKDWNEQVMVWRGSKPISRLIERGKML